MADIDWEAAYDVLLTRAATVEAERDRLSQLVSRIEALKGVEPSYFDERAPVVSIATLQDILKDA